MTTIRPCFSLPFFAALLAISTGCGSRTGTASDSPSPSDPSSGHKSPGGINLSSDDAAFLQDASRTPGDTLDVTKDDVCRPGYSRLVRNVPDDVKRQVYADYGIAHHRPGEYEVDHLISLELGGSNRSKNLWPQSYTTRPWNAHVKDELENELHRQVCSGDIDLPTAQNWISQDWVAAYRRVFHSNAPASTGIKRHRDRPSNSDRAQLTGAREDRQQAGGDTVAPASGSDGTVKEVWVNTNSGKYFRPGARYYGHTRQGEFMSEEQALQQGYHAAKDQ